MSSIIWLDEPETSVLYNVGMEKMPDWLIRPSLTQCPSRHIIARGNILEGRVGK